MKGVYTIIYFICIVLKLDQIDQSNRFNWELAINLIRLWVKTKNNLKIEEIRKPDSLIEKRGTGMAESVNDLLGFFYFFQPKTTSFWAEPKH